MANRLIYSIVLTLCLMGCCGTTAVSETIQPIQQEKQETPLDKFQMGKGSATETNVDILATAPKTVEPPVSTTTTKSRPSLVVVVPIPLLSSPSTSPVTTTTQLAEEMPTVISSLTDAPPTFNASLETGTPTVALPSPLQVTSTVRTTYPDAELSAESFDSGESSSSDSFYSKLPSISWPTQSLAQDKNPLPLSTTPLPIAPLWPWMLFILNGNATVANRRQRDLGTYLRLNLAARLDADYNDVAINRIILTPQAIVANISVEPSHLVYGGTGAAGLEALGQGNVTLLELSGHEFQVDRIIRFDQVVDQRGIMNSIEMSSMVATVGSEVTVYGAVGAVFLFLLVALLLGLSFSNPCKSSDNRKFLANSSLAYDRDQMECNYLTDGFVEWGISTMELMPTSPPVIYTEQLARDIEGDNVGLEQLLKNPSHFISSSRSKVTSTADSTLAELHHHERHHNSHDSLYDHNRSFDVSRS